MNLTFLWVTLLRFIFIHKTLFQANLESPIILDASLLRSLRPSPAAADFVFDLSLLQ